MLVPCISAEGLETRIQDFSADPNWSTLGNGQNGNNFGWSPTSYAGGEHGEGGGRFTRSAFVRYLADTNLGGSFTIEDAFAASGTFGYTDHNVPDFGNGFTIGHFSGGTADSNANGTKVGISFGDNSRRQGLWWQGAVVIDSGLPLLTPPLSIPANQAVNWSYELTNDINGAGDAQVTFNLDGFISTLHLDTAQQEELTAHFDAFGFVGSNVGENPRSDWFADMFMDDVTYSVVSNSPPPPPRPPLPTRTQTFHADPGWSIQGNGQNANDFGWSPTSNTGGDSGEIGGHFTRSAFPRFYADDDLRGTMTLDEPFGASGSFILTDQNRPDFGRPFLIGHFDENGLATSSPANFVGLHVDNGGTVTDAYWTLALHLADGTDLAPPKSLITENVVLPWFYEWDPAEGAHGVFRISLGEEFKSVALTERQRETGLSMALFGIAGVEAPSSETPSWFADLFIDDVTYTIARPPLVGDYDNSGDISQRDLDIVLLFWGDNLLSIPINFNGYRPTGIIDQEELDAVLLNWGATFESLAAAVPEPAAASIVLISVLCLPTFLILSSCRRQDCR